MDIREKICSIHSDLADIINGITNDDYASSPLIVYVNDSLSTLCEYLEYVISLKMD